MTKRQTKPVPVEKKPDYARGQRELAAAVDRDHGDFARGERQALKTEEELRHPDFAEGQRDLPKPNGEHPDYARGQERDPQNAGGADEEDDDGVIMEFKAVEIYDVDDGRDEDDLEDDDLGEDDPIGKL